MLIHQIYAENNLRNFNYLIACPDTKDALVVDPLDVQRCLGAAAAHGWTITQILNTHEHPDHIEGNPEMVRATGAKILAHHGAKIPNVDVRLKAGDIVKVGSSVELNVMDTPGHTMSHVCMFVHGDNPALISGDTLFNAGVGHCHRGGDPEVLYKTFVTQLANLPDNTRIFPGHDYIINNLKFTLDREPGNAAAIAMLEKLKDHDPHHAYITTLKEEKTFNTFFRLSSPAVIAALKGTEQDVGDHPSEKQVFIALRALRNKW